jgi:hypothetical protein
MQRPPPFSGLRPRSTTLARIIASAGAGLVLCLASTASAAAEDRTLRTGAQVSRESLGGAVSAPLRDLNLVRADIPPVLIQTLDNPYARPSSLSCERLAARIADLDAVLGEDYGAQDRATGDARPMLLSAVASTVTDLLPMRGWIRKLSGADRHEREVREAIRAGAVRRGFLKGLAKGHGCGAGQRVVFVDAQEAAIARTNPGLVTAQIDDQALSLASTP